MTTLDVATRVRHGRVAVVAGPDRVLLPARPLMARVVDVLWMLWGDRWPINVVLLLAGLFVLGVAGLFAGTALR